MTPPTPPPPPPPPPAPRCYHDMNMKTLRCQICGAFAPHGYDGNGGVNLESWPTAEDFGKSE